MNAPVVVLPTGCAPDGRAGLTRRLAVKLLGRIAPEALGWHLAALTDAEMADALALPDAQVLPAILAASRQAGSMALARGDNPLRGLGQRLGHSLEDGFDDAFVALAFRQGDQEGVQTGLQTRLDRLGLVERLGLVKVPEGGGEIPEGVAEQAPGQAQDGLVDAHRLRAIWVHFCRFWAGELADRARRRAEERAGYPADHGPARASGRRAAA